MRVLAIDPGYERMGVAVIEKAEKEKLLFSGCIVTARQNSFGERLVILAEAVEKIIAEYEPNLVALEKLFFTVNQKTASAVSEVRGMLLYLTAKHHLELIEYTPLEIKSTITGFGKASKDQMTTMVRQLITLPHEPKYDDEFDAIGIGLTALARVKFNG